MRLSSKSYMAVCGEAHYQKESKRLRSRSKADTRRISDCSRRVDWS